MLWDDLGFATNYTIDPEPEYPGDGIWRDREVRIAAPDAILSGGPLAIVMPDGEDPWLLAAELPGVGALYGTPDPNVVCLFDRFERVLLIDVRMPDRQTRLDFPHPVAIAAARDEQLLLLTDSWTVAAFDSEGTSRWHTDPLVGDDLHIRRTDNGRIVCRGITHPGFVQVEVTLDAATGRILGA